MIVLEQKEKLLFAKIKRYKLTLNQINSRENKCQYISNFDNFYPFYLFTLICGVSIPSRNEFVNLIELINFDSPPPKSSENL